MATLRLNVLASVPIPLADVGITLPALSAQDFTDPAMIRALGGSSSLRAAMDLGQVSISDGEVSLTKADLAMYFYGAGMGPLTGLVLEDSLGNLWRVQVVAGALALTPIT